jgi:ABC-type oligopeptide transport system substrate-binding subunit
VRGERFAPLATIVEDNLEALGIDLAPEVLDNDAFFQALDPTTQVPIAIGDGWVKDFPSGSTWFEPLFSSEALGNPNTSLVGATGEQLEALGYPPVEVPSVDGKIAECLEAPGSAQFACWAELDQLLMEQVVPWVPYAGMTDVRTFSPRVESFSIDQAFTLPALDRIALVPEER